VDLAARVMLKGPWYAVEQCRNLLRDTEILDQAKAYASKCDRRECRGEQVLNSGKPPSDHTICPSARNQKRL